MCPTQAYSWRPQGKGDKQHVVSGPSPCPHKLLEINVPLSAEPWLVPGLRQYIPPSSGPDSAMGLSRERQHFDAMGLHPHFVVTIQSARAILYVAKWQAFEAW